MRKVNKYEITYVRDGSSNTLSVIANRMGEAINAVTEKDLEGNYLLEESEITSVCFIEEVYCYKYL